MEAQSTKFRVLLTDFELKVIKAALRFSMEETIERAALKGQPPNYKTNDKFLTAERLLKQLPGREFGNG